jgi:acyl-coenzyme A synthetase/AMP-(fatty) acid ligase
VPREIVFVDSIPRTDAGKVDRPALDRKLATESDAEQLDQVS